MGTRKILLTDQRGGGTPYNGLNGEALPESGIPFLGFRREGVSRFELHERQGNMSFGL